jgi:hypothetical protein
VEFRDTLLKAMQETGIFDRLHPDTKDLMGNILIVGGVEYIKAKGYLQVRREELKNIVEKLAIQRDYSPELAKRISVIINTPEHIVEELVQELIQEGLMQKVLAAGEKRKARSDAAKERRKKNRKTLRNEVRRNSE